MKKMIIPVAAALLVSLGGNAQTGTKAQPNKGITTAASRAVIAKPATTTTTTTMSAKKDTKTATKPAAATAIKRKHARKPKKVKPAGKQ